MVLKKIAHLPVSAFGRAAAALAYALGKVLYHLEFQGFPRLQNTVNGLLSRVAAVVDRRLSPAAYAVKSTARPAGVSREIMQLPPVCCGFGLLPLRQHVRARHAGLAVRCVLGACSWLPYVPPWTRVTMAWLRQCHVAATALCLLVPSDDQRVLGKAVQPACASFRRLVGAMAHLPTVTLVVPPEVGARVYRVPLWGIRL